MKKIYKKPLAKIIELETECLIAQSPNGGMGDGASVGNQKPTDDNDDNLFSNSYRIKLWED